MNFGSGPFQSWDRYQDQRLKFQVQQQHRLLLGLPQWGESAWKGILYPPRMSESEFLSHYSKVLDCVEVSSTFYAPVSKQRFMDWARQTPDSFRFVPKWPQLISHQKLLVNVQIELKEFVNASEGLEHKLGVSLLQMPPHFSRNFHRELYQFLLQVPENFPLCLEFRHASWFEEGFLYSKLYDYLAGRNIGMACSDLPGRSDLFHQSFCGSRNLVRFLSDENRENDQRRLEYWRKQLTEKTLGEEFYFFLHQAQNDTVCELIELFSLEHGKRIENARADQQQSLF